MQMPPDANIPYEYQVGTENGRLLVVVPSWSQTDKTSYLVAIDKTTREMWCECKGFEMHGTCHHVKGLKWFCSHPVFRRKGVTKTSIESFHALTKEMLSDRQQTVLKAIEILETASDREIAHALGWPINCEIPRRSEIEDMGIIRCVGDQFDSTTQRTVMVWSVA